MATAPQPPAYSIREIINRYESEEDEFVRELEDMRQSLENSEQEEEVPQDPAPILSVLCSLVDEIGSLRSENRQLKTRLAPAPNRTRNVVQRMSAIFDSKSSFLPKLRRPAHSEVRNGARERLSTPPRKDCLTTSSISTDFSHDSRERAPPLVEPEQSDSDVDDNIFSEDQDHHEPFPRRGRRDSTRRCQMSLSECTSPSSASSSREPSEAMTSSRSSFFEMFGFRKQRPDTVAHLPPAKPVLKKKKRRISQDDLFADIHRSRQQNKNRPTSYYPREDSEDSDNMRSRKTNSFLNVNNNSKNNDSILRVDRETRLRHEKEGLAAEIEEMKMRNQRLVEQLREKSAQNSKLQIQMNRLENQIDTLFKRCALSDALDKLTLDERIMKAPVEIFEKIEERLRLFESQMQALKIDAGNQHQKVLNLSAQEKSAHQNCLEQLERLQRENLKLMHDRYSDCDNMDSSVNIRIDALPSYEKLYAFTSGVIRKLAEMRWNLLGKAWEANRTEMDLIATQSSLLVTHAQVERLRLRQRVKGRRQKRPSSYHGEPYTDRVIKTEMNFFLPFKLQGSRLENRRRIHRKKSNEQPTQSLEQDFLRLFESVAPTNPEKTTTRPTSRIDLMMREMSGGTRSKLKPFSAIPEKLEKTNRRPISLVEDDVRLRRYDDNRRSIKHTRDTSGEKSNMYKATDMRCVVSSLQDMNSAQSPHQTPLTARRLLTDKRPTSRLYPAVGEARTRKLERGLSGESRTEDLLYHDQQRDGLFRLRKELNKEKEDRRREEQRVCSQEIPRPTRIQRSQPVQLSRLRPPSATQYKMRTLEPQRVDSMKLERSKTLRVEEVRDDPKMTKPDKKSWLEKIRAMKKTPS